QALISVVATSYLLGVSTRRVDKLVEQLGIKHISKSQVSQMAKTLDEQVEAFRTRALDAGPYTFVWLDALTQKVREGGRTINVHALVATGVNANGQREVLGLDVTSAEDGAGWLAFLRGLVARGLSGVQLVVSDAHRGLVEAIGAALPGAAWQRCRTHWSRQESRCRFCDTWDVVVRCDGVQERVGAGVSGCGSGDGVAGLLQQRANPELGVADSSSAHLKQFGYDLPGADFAHAEDDRQDALGVGDFLLEDASAGAGLPVTAALAMLAPLGLGGLPQRQPLDQCGQFRATHPGQCRISEQRQPVRPCRDDVAVQEVAERTGAGEAQHGGVDLEFAGGQELAGLGDRLADRGLADLEQL
ncbi:IS256 family transposase, partial [Nonomuraea guangzhouensis]|uniref:IS256 family transposase n=1 Tax=Nonomuraea guangzhouensis TaxID=1291555 RepID=UPI001FE4010E